VYDIKGKFGEHTVQQTLLVQSFTTMDLL